MFERLFFSFSFLRQLSSCCFCPWPELTFSFGCAGVECYCQHESGAAVIQLQFLINEVCCHDLFLVWFSLHLLIAPPPPVCLRPRICLSSWSAAGTVGTGARRPLMTTRYAILCFSLLVMWPACLFIMPSQLRAHDTSPPPPWCSKHQSTEMFCAFATLSTGGAGECLSRWQHPPVEPEAEDPCDPAFSQVQQGEVQ